MPCEVDSQKISRREDPRRRGFQGGGRESHRFVKHGRDQEQRQRGRGAGSNIKCYPIVKSG